MDTLQKPVHTIILDTAPIIKDTPPASTLRGQSHELLTVPSLVDEIQDRDTRSRFETTLRPFVVLREPRPESVKVIVDFARRTGDLSVLSSTDIKVLALAYEVECERNGGDWRLRRTPGQKSLNGSPPHKAAESNVSAAEEQSRPPEGQAHAEVEDPVKKSETSLTPDEKDGGGASLPNDPDTDALERHLEAAHLHDEGQGEEHGENDGEEHSQDSTPPQGSAEPELFANGAEEHTQDLNPSRELAEVEQSPNEQSEDSDPDSEGWITPSNLKRRQAEDASHTSPASSTKEPRTIQVATLTTDFAMQNVLLQMNLNLLSPSLQRVRHIKTYILRCHACFEKVKDTSKQFCPRCGKPTLTRVSCSTNEKGEFKMHLKKNMQWNTRGDRYSIPKPVASTASGKIKGGGGKGGWGQTLILAEDQKEYSKAVRQQSRMKERDLMDDDYLPGILSGERAKQGGRPKIGAGRNINSRRQR